MNQVKNYLPLGLLAALILKLLAKGLDSPEMGVTIAVAAIVALKDYLEKSKTTQEIESFVKKELEEIRNVVVKQNEVIEKMAKAIDENKTGLASVRLSQGYSQRKGA